MYDFDLFFFFFWVICSTLIHPRKSVFESNLKDIICNYRTKKCSMEQMCQLLKRANTKMCDRWMEGWTERLNKKKWSWAGWHKNYWPEIHYSVSVILQSKQFCCIIITIVQTYKIQNHSAVTYFNFHLFHHQKVLCLSVTITSNWTILVAIIISANQ